MLEGSIGPDFLVGTRHDDLRRASGNDVLIGRGGTMTFAATPGVIAAWGAARNRAVSNVRGEDLASQPVAKKVLTQIKLQIPAGAANPAPPVGPALGQHGVNIMEFCKAFNAQTQQDAGTIIPVEITVYEDRSFDFITKTPPRRS